MHTHKRRIGHTLLAGGAFIWLSLSVAVNFTPTNSYAVTTADVFSTSNVARANNGLQALTGNSKLNQAAAAKANHMLNNGYFAHTAPDGTTGWDFINSSGYSYASAAENLATSNQGANAVVDGWLNSPGHRANLLSGTYKDVGYGSVFVGDWEYQGVVYANTYFVVALYGFDGSEQPAAATTAEPVVQQPQASTESAQQPVAGAVEETPSEPEPAEASPLSDPSEAGVTSQYIEERTSGTAPVASLAPTEDDIIGPRVAIILATVALTAVVAGIVLEIRWIKHHSHVAGHLPHLHHS